MEDTVVEKPRVLLKPSEINTLVRCEKMLDSVMKQVRKRGQEAWDDKEGYQKLCDDFDLGRVYEAMDVCKTSVFEVLNTASSIGRCDNAKKHFTVRFADKEE